VKACQRACRMSPKEPMSATSMRPHRAHRGEYLLAAAAWGGGSWRSMPIADPGKPQYGEQRESNERASSQKSFSLRYLDVYLERSSAWRVTTTRISLVSFCIE